MALLGVNIDHVATIREARKTNEPDPVFAAFQAENAGCHGITCHLREDRRHINERDVDMLRQVVKTRLNLEMALSDEIIKYALNLNPDQCTLVPEKREEITTEGGLDVIKNYDLICKTSEAMLKQNINVSLFIDPDEKQIKASNNAGVPCIEIHTGAYANAPDNKTKEFELTKIKNSIDYADSLGIIVNAGHGLTYHNIQPLVTIKKIYEFNIGHSIISKAVFSGLENAVKEMLELLK